jgi:hypothetical protein
VTELSQQLTSLDDVHAFVGPVNFQMITEWHGHACDPPQLTLKLPAAQPGVTPFSQPSGIAKSSAQGTSAQVTVLEQLWDGHDACK